MVELSIRLTFPMQTNKLLNGVGSLNAPALVFHVKWLLFWKHCLGSTGTDNLMVGQVHFP